MSKYYNINILVFFVVLLIFSACGTDVHNDSKGKIIDSLMVESKFHRNCKEQILMRQLEAGAYCEAYDNDSTKNYIYTDNDLNAVTLEITEYLTNKGLAISPDSFDMRLYQRLGIRINGQSYIKCYDSRSQLYLSDKSRSRMVKGIMFNINKLKKEQASIYIFDPCSGLILPIVFMPEVIDYFKSYPSAARMELELKKMEVNKFGRPRTLRWCDDDAADKNRKNLLEKIYHINNYTQMGDMASFRWLSKHNPEFLCSLFTDLGCDYVVEIDSFVLEQVKKRKLRPESLFVDRDESKSLLLRAGLIDYISSHERADLNSYYQVVKWSIGGMVGVDCYKDKNARFPQILLDSFTEDQRLYATAHLLNMMFPLYKVGDVDKLIKMVVNKMPSYPEYCYNHDFFDLPELRRGISIFLTIQMSRKWKVRKYTHGVVK